MVRELTLEQLVTQAKEGDKAALEALVCRVQDQIYNLALRMLWRHDDAEDATQEILIKVITHLSQFRQESTFTTWVYRVASNHLLTTRKRFAEQKELTLEAIREQLEDGTLFLGNAPEMVEDVLLVKEIQTRCTMGMLLCLDREQRLAYILGEGFEVSSEEGAHIMEVTPATFRKRLSRARLRLRAFMEEKCGLVNPTLTCRCTHLVPHKKYEGTHSTETQVHSYSQQIEIALQEFTTLGRMAFVFRTHPQYSAPNTMIEAIKHLLSSHKFSIFK